MKNIYYLLVILIPLHATSLMDSFKLHKIDNKNEEVSEKQIVLLERNSLAIKEITRKYKDLQYLEVIKIINNNIMNFENDEREKLLLLKLQSLFKLKKYRKIVDEIIQLDENNRFSGINVAKAHLMLARCYLEQNKFNKFKTEISTLDKNFEKNNFITDNLNILKAWYNVKNKSYSKAIRLCETVLVNSSNLDMASEASFILSIIDKKTSKKANNKFINDIVEHNPDFFNQNFYLVEKYPELFKESDNIDNNILILENSFKHLKPTKDFKTFRKIAMYLVELHKHKGEWDKALEYLKKLENHVLDLQLLKDKVDEQIDLMNILIGSTSIETVLKNSEKNKHKNDYFLVFKLIKDMENGNNNEIINYIQKYEDVSSKTYKKHNILNKHKFLSDVYMKLLLDYLDRIISKEDTTPYNAKFVKKLLVKTRTSSNKLLNEREYELAFLDTLNKFGEFHLNNEIFQKYQDENSISILKTISQMFFKNNDFDELLHISKKALELNDNFNFDELFDFYEYLIHIYKFKSDKIMLKSTYDEIIDSNDKINNEKILTIVDTYFTFLNNNKESFGEYTKKEINKVIYDYLSISSKYPNSKLNKQNNYYFLLANKLFKKKNYNNFRLILEKIVPDNDIDKSKLNYFYLMYFKNTNDMANFKIYQEKCNNLSNNEWKEKCLNFR